MKEPVVGEDWMTLSNNEFNNNVNNDKEEEIIVALLLQSRQFTDCGVGGGGDHKGLIP